MDEGRARSQDIGHYPVFGRCCFMTSSAGCSCGSRFQDGDGNLSFPFFGWTKAGDNYGTRGRSQIAALSAVGTVVALAVAELYRVPLASQQSANLKLYF